MLKKLILTGVALFSFAMMAVANNQVIVVLKPNHEQLQQMKDKKGTLKVRYELMQTLSQKKLKELEKAAGVTLFDDVGYIALGGRVLRTQKNLSDAEMQNLIKKLDKVSWVKYASENKPVYPSDYTPNPMQWDIYDQTTSVPGATTRTYYGDSYFTNGSQTPPDYNGSGITVAVVDTGYIPHPNFNANLVYTSSNISGYQFIQDCRRAGSCPTSTPDDEAALQPQPNALDLGSYLTQAEYDSIPSDSNFKASCTNADGSPALSNSNWHGSFIAGLIAGQGMTANTGILGTAYGAKVLPVRFMGKCGGSTTDAINATLWAAGLSPDASLPQPIAVANVINYSAGAPSTGCSQEWSEAIDDLAKENISFVVAASNEHENVSNSEPANCSGAISVAAVGPVKNLATYSNWGDVTIAASGGDFLQPKSESTDPNVVQPNGTVYSTFYNSKASYSSDSAVCGDNCFIYKGGQGTSYAAPHVAAAIADLLSINTDLSISSLVNYLQETATPLQTSCNSGGCISVGQINITAAADKVKSDMTPETPTCWCNTSGTWSGSASSCCSESSTQCTSGTDNFSGCSGAVEVSGYYCPTNGNYRSCLTSSSSSCWCNTSGTWSGSESSCCSKAGTPCVFGSQNFSGCSGETKTSEYYCPDSGDYKSCLYS